MQSSIFIRNVKYLITCDNEDRVYKDINILLENGVISYIGKEEKEASVTLDGTNKIAYPGLINTHHHLYQTFSRNLSAVQNMELFPWLSYLYQIWKNLDSSIIYHSSLTGMGELLKYGCTTCFDHHYVFPKDCGDLLGAQFAAAKKLGIRFVASRGSMSLSKKDGGLPPDSVVQSLDEILTDSRNCIERHHDSRPFSMHQVVLAPCSPFSVTRDGMVESAKLARSYGVRLHTHLAETLDEEVYVKEHYSMRPLALMESLGWMGSDVWFAHGIHFNDQEIRRLADTKTGIAHCPVSNMKLASGVAKIPKMLESGIPVGLAVDGSASNDGSNLLEEMRIGFLLHRLHSSTKAPSGYDFLKLATRGSASLLGRDEIGCLALGKAADLFLVDTNRIECIGADFDPKSMLATVGLKRPVDVTIVNGKIVVKDGKLYALDEEILVREARQSVSGFLNKSDIR